MATDNTIVKCGRCKAVLNERSDTQPAQRTPCPKCGSTSRAFAVTVYESISFKERVGIKGKHPGEKNPFIEQISGADLFRKIGKWMHLSRIIDREHDWYSEVITDPATGKVVRKCEEPLSEHKGHGSAKHKKNTPGCASP